MSGTSPIRVLIVDDNLNHRRNFADFVAAWGYLPVVAEGRGPALLSHARRLSRERRCHLALVDMRLIEDSDPNDRSGLELIRDLLPTRSIVLSSFGTIRTALSATQQYGATSFVEKTGDPEVLREELHAAASQLCLNGHGPQIVWPGGLSSVAVHAEMFPGNAAIPDDEAEILIRLLYPGKAVVRLTRITASPDQLPSEAVSPTEAGATLRRASRVFVAEIAGDSALQVVKLARTDKIEREATHFGRYVRGGLKSTRRPETTGTALLWDMGAIAYRLVGYGHLDEGKAQIFTRVYRRTTDPSALLAPLHDFFGYDAWGNWYRERVRPLEGSLVEAYEHSWRDGLARHLNAWGRQDHTQLFEPLAITLPNPLRWYVEHRASCPTLPELRQAITHGDLHGDNLFVDNTHAWPVDFERTGYGPILRDFVELVQDLTTRIARLAEHDLAVAYALASAIAAPRHPDEPMRASQLIVGHPEAWKLFTVVEQIQRLAFERTRYVDRREYLWGLLCNHLFVASKLSATHPRWAPTLLFAAVICHRLEHWNSVAWAPPG